MARTFCRSDRGIHNLKGLSAVQVEPLLTALKADKSRVARSLRRECRLWFKRNVQPVAKPRITGNVISFQDGMSNDKIIVATV
jgi:hypothetical protein